MLSGRFRMKKPPLWKMIIALWVVVVLVLVGMVMTDLPP